MKDKILLFVIGVLVGAVIATGAFFVYSKAVNTNNCNNNQTMQLPGGENGQPPEKPGENDQRSSNSGNENGQPPEKPGENNSQNSNN